MHDLTLGDVVAGDTQFPSADVAKRARRSMSEFRIEQILERLSPQLEIEHAVDRPTDRADRVTTGVHGDAASDRRVVVAGSMVDDAEVFDDSELNKFAMNYAVHNTPKDRDGELAVEAAMRACELTSYSKPHILDTLATAYAEKGDFDAAAKWQLKAIELLKGSEESELYEEHLKLFREKKTVTSLK